MAPVTFDAALIGFGNVGRALAGLLLKVGRSVEDAQGVTIRLVLVADRSGVAVDPAGLDLQTLLDVKARTGGVAAYPGGGRPGVDAGTALDTLQADLLFEASPTSAETGEPGLSYIRAALERGMHVVNANKGPLVVAYHDLHALAERQGVALRNSGTVGAPLPTFDLLRYALHGVVVESIEAIPNGTTNYILSLMERGRSFEQGLEAAQDAGIAEPDPSLDIDGLDSAAKIMIMASAFMGAHVRLSDVVVEGIGQITVPEVVQARDEGVVLKLLATARRRPDGVDLAVGPTRLDLDHPLARLKDTGMGVVLTTDILGTIVLTVEGDAPLGTAQSMLRDAVNIGRGW